MAAHRLLGREVATSLRLNEMTERNELAYIKAMPFTDRDGRLPGEARKLRGQCFPMRDWSVSDVEEIIKNLTAAELWSPYTDDAGKEAIQVLRFHDHQPGVRPGTARYRGERPSVFGPPPTCPRHGTDTDPTRDRHGTDTGPTPNERERKGTKGKGERAAPPALDPP